MRGRIVSPRRETAFERTQAGAVLVIGLILLSVLTVLAASTLSTATLELAMSGNDQYRNRALLAAEAGVERAIAAGALNAVGRESRSNATLSNGDSYTVAIRPRGLTAAPPGYNPVFSAEHFQVESTGTSAAGASVTIIEGLFVVRPAASSAAPSAGSPRPPACLTGIEILPALCVPAGQPVRTYWRYGSAPRS